MESAPSSKSWAYHGDDGGLFNYTGFHPQDNVEQYGPGDTIGCGVDFGTGKIWYTKNGKMIGKLGSIFFLTFFFSSDSESRGIKTNHERDLLISCFFIIDKGFERVMGRLFPVVGLKDKATLVANFGGDLDSRPFVWKENEEVK
jgi:hypothetical protein